MTPETTDFFYSRLPVNEIPLSELLAEEHLFYSIPESWHVLLTDVKGSTAAVAAGKHETVNLVATGSIVAVLNLAYKADIIVPFFFGGDGATFIIPPFLLEQAKKALEIHKENTLRNFDLHLRVGHLPVNTIYEQQHQLKVTKLKTSRLFSIPVMLGTGLHYAEKIIKSEDYSFTPVNITDNELDMTGMECRWDKIKPPESYNEVISLIVVARHDKQAAVFKKVIEHIDRIYGEYEKRKPISEEKLRLKATIKKISSEMKVKLGGYRPVYLVQKLMATMLGTVYFKTKPGKEYLQQLVQLSDTLVIDGRINTVISGTTAQRRQLEEALDTMERNGEIFYGLHVSKESVLSCYVRNMNEKHIHFVDGSDGGYTRAAGVLKSKLFANKL